MATIFNLLWGGSQAATLEPDLTFHGWFKLLSFSNLAGVLRPLTRSSASVVWHSDCLNIQWKGFSERGAEFAGARRRNRRKINGQ